MIDVASFLGLAGSSREALYFKNFSVYSQGAKWGTAAKATIDLDAEGGELFFERGEFIGSSTGVLKTALQIEAFVPEGGKLYQEQIIAALRMGAYVFCTCGNVGQQIIQLGYMTVRSVKVDGDMARGVTTMHVSLAGGSAEAMKSTPALPLRLGGI